MGDSKEQPDEFGDAKMIGEPDSAGSFANVEAIDRDGGATPATLVASSTNGVEAQLLPTTGSGDSVFDFERWTSMVVIKGQSSCRFTFRDPCSSLNYGLLNDAHPHPPSPPPLHQRRAVRMEEMREGPMKRALMPKPQLKD